MGSLAESSSVATTIFGLGGGTTVTILGRHSATFGGVLGNFLVGGQNHGSRGMRWCHWPGGGCWRGGSQCRGGQNGRNGLRGVNGWESVGRKGRRGGDARSDRRLWRKRRNTIGGGGVVATSSVRISRGIHEFPLTIGKLVHARIVRGVHVIVNGIHALVVGAGI